MQQNPPRDQLRNILRSTLRKARKNLTVDQVAVHSASICTQADELLSQTGARHIAAYYAFGNEVDLSTLMAGFEAQQKTSYVPIVLPEYQMQFASVNSQTQTHLNGYGIKEPQIDNADLVDASSLDAVLVPLVGFDEHCNRMGMGGGYYDRCFAHRRDQSLQKPVLIGVAYEIQGVANVHTENWDVPLDYIITERRIIQRKNNS